MKRGRRPKPTALKQLAGNPGKRPLDLTEPKPAPPPASDCKQPPAWLDAQAREEWRRIVPELHRLGLFTTVDQGSIEAYCVAYSQFRKATAQLKRGGVVDTPNGSKQIAPWVSTAQKWQAVMRAWAVEFGLTPASRTSLHSGRGALPSLPMPKGDQDSGPIRPPKDESQEAAAFFDC